MDQSLCCADAGFGNAIDVFLVIGAVYASMNIPGFFEKILNFFGVPFIEKNDIDIERLEELADRKVYNNFRKLNAIYAFNFLLLAMALVVFDEIEFAVFAYFIALHIFYKICLRGINKLQANFSGSEEHKLFYLVMWLSLLTGSALGVTFVIDWWLDYNSLPLKEYWLNASYVVTIIFTIMLSTRRIIDFAQHLLDSTNTDASQSDVDRVMPQGIQLKL